MIRRAIASHAMLLVLASATLAGRALAAPPSGEEAKREAKRELASGDDAYARKDYSGALAHYQKAYEDFASPKILYPIGLAQLQLGQYAAAEASLERYTTLVPQAEAGPSYADARAKLAEVAEHVATVRVVTHPDGASLTIDGTPIGPTPSSLTLDPGSHQLHLEHAGDAPLDETITVTSGSQTVERTLAPLHPLAPPAPSTGPSGSLAAELWRAPPTRASVLATGTLAVAAIGTGIGALLEHSMYTNPQEPLAVRQSAQSTGRILAITTDVLWVGAIGGAGFTWYWYRHHSHPERATLQAIVTPCGAAFGLAGSL